MLDLDAVGVDLDTAFFDLDGVPVGQPVIAHGGGTPIHTRPFVPIRAAIVGRAAAEFGPLEAHAAAVVSDRKLRDLESYRDDLEVLLLIDGDSVWWFELDSVEFEIKARRADGFR